MTRERSTLPALNARRPGSRAGIGTAEVVASARAVYERDGLDALTMRGVARELGVAPNALYSHVPDKDGLVDLLIDALLGEIALPSGRLPWDVAVTRLMKNSRVVLLRHPALMAEFLGRPTRGPNALRLGEATLRLLARGGIEGTAAVTALRVLLVFTLGFAAMEAPRAADPDPAARTARSREAYATAGEHSRALAGPLARHPDDATFDLGLRWLLAGIASSNGAAGDR